MKRKIINVLIAIFMMFTFLSCGTTTEQPTPPSGGGIIDNPENPNNPDNPDNPDGPNNEEKPNDTDNPGPVVTEVEFVVSLVYNKKLYIPEEEEEIIVVWGDDYSQHTQKIGIDGYAKILLDGDFYVYIDNIPEGYTYNPNIYSASNDNPIVEIELLKISKISRGNGTKLYSEYELSTTGTYRTEIKSKTKKVFYEYQPTSPGYYVIESIVNIHEDVVNPKVDIYTGSFAAKYFSETLDDGGTYKKGGYTKNFKWVVKLSQEQLSNVFTFAIFAQSKTGEYPVYVDFKISYEGEYYLESTLAKLMEAQEIKANRYCKNCGYPASVDDTPAVCPSCGETSFSGPSTKTPEFDSSYKYINSDGGSGSYYASLTNGTGFLDANNFKYNEETGYWHVYDKETNTYGPVLCAKITAPCAYYDESLNLIESHGNKNLTVSNLTENYKQFIEVEYASVCNSDGVCYVTNELKEFLQKFSVSQRLFFDGNGFVESTGVYAIEEDQWLFACGYYKKK